MIELKDLGLNPIYYVDELDQIWQDTEEMEEYWKEQAYENGMLDDAGSDFIYEDYQTKTGYRIINELHEHTKNGLIEDLITEKQDLNNKIKALIKGA